MTMLAQFAAAAGGVAPAYIEDVFSTYLYTGNNSTQTINNGIDLAGKGGMIWFKPRDAVASHVVFDTVRGPTKFVVPNSASFGEITNTVGNDLTSFNANGFSLGPSQTSSVNVSGTSQVAWTFRKQPKFFDVQTFTSNGSGGATVSHTLGSSPGFVIVKSLASGAWAVWHRSMTSTSYYMVLNSTNAQSNLGVTWLTPSSTNIVFDAGAILAANANYVMYVFAHDAGGFGLSGSENVVSCGSYTGVTYPNSLEVNVGFEPQFVIIKNATTASGWTMWDTMRGMTVIPAANTAQALLLEPNTTAAESSQPGIYPTATGFVVKNGLTSISGTGDNIVYIAIRRGPMKAPTLGTSVFAPVANSLQSFTTGFPVDWLFAQKRTFSAGNLVAQRLTGSTIYLSPQVTDAEYTTGPTFNFADNTGVVTTYNGGGNPHIWYGFQRAPSFFDVVCYTNDGGRAPRNHNLTVVPELVITKTRGVSGSWYVTQYLSTPPTYRLLQTADAFISAGSNYPVTATTFVSLAESSSTEVTYLFATCAGVSKVGSYTGTGATQAINCGFTAGARFVMIKRTDAVGDWYFWDSARGIVAGNDPYLLINDTAAEVTSTDYVDTSATGFELSSTAPAAINASGGTFIFLAVA